MKFIRPIFKFLGITILVIASGSLLAVLAAMFVINDHTQEWCDRLANVAQQEGTIKYLDRWTLKHILDKGYVSAWGMHGQIYAFNTENDFVLIEAPQEKYSMIKPEYFRFGLDKVGSDHDVQITSSNVGRLFFGDGRNSIILLKNAQGLGTFGENIKGSRKILRINERTYVYCSDVRFSKELFNSFSY